MKKTLLFFAAIGLNIVAFAQQDQTDPQTKSSNPMNQPGNTSLDGKVFAVTLTDNSSTSVNGTTGSMSSEGAMDNPDITQPKRTDQGTDMNSKTGKKMILRFENGMIKTSGKGIMKVEKCGYTSAGIASTGISFNADCESSNTSVKGTQNSGTSSTLKSTSQTGSSGYVMPATSTGTNKSSGSSATNPTSAQTGSGTSSSTADMNSSSSDKSKVNLTGTVNDDSIHGTMTCTKTDGTVKTYSYVGKTADRNDLDVEGETGMK